MMNEKKPKVRALGRPEIEHLAETVRGSVVVLFTNSPLSDKPDEQKLRDLINFLKSERLIPLAQQTTNILAEALEEFAKTVTEP